ncbi:MAG: ribosome maturation factor RimM [Clostridiales bacterium]|jgi:16S rRNA processing protein RimM|nr:ribosome maturation factor RimM [Clostridiales bacterium]
MREIGTIINTCGLKGEMKVCFYDYNKNFLNNFLNNYIYIDDKKYILTSLRYYKRYFYIKLDSICDLENAKILKNKIIKTENDLELKENEYFQKDIIGLKVFDFKDKKIIGEIVKIIDNPVHDLYLINDFVLDKSFMLPAVKEFIQDINLDKKIMYVNLVEGLRELN